MAKRAPIRRFLLFFFQKIFSSETCGCADAASDILQFQTGREIGGAMEAKDVRDSGRTQHRPPGQCENGRIRIADLGSSHRFAKRTKNKYKKHNLLEFSTPPFTITLPLFIVPET